MQAESATRIQPPEVSFENAQLLLARREVPEAIHAYNRAEQFGYPKAECSAGRWQCWMLLGEFERAWEESDKITAENADEGHVWDGSSWTGRRLMLRCLHGLGDTIQFIRYAPLLRQVCKELIVQTHPQLVSLISNARGVDRAITWEPSYREERFDWDLQMEVTELPRAFRTTRQTIPSSFPYIFVPPLQLAQAAQWFPSKRKPRVGLVWRAGPWDESRSIELLDLEPLFRLPNLEFYCLQKDAEGELEPYRSILPNPEAHSRDVLDTAALICHVDLVITVDTMTAHLTGALGKQVWIMLPEISDWRWMLETSQTPWYATARLFRRKASQGWAFVIAEVTQALAETLGSMRSGTSR